MNTLPDGAWPVMLTPFHADLSIDLETLDRYTDWLIEHDAAGLFPVALSGEMYQLDEQERLVVAHRVVERAAGRVPVIASVAERATPAETAAAVARLAGTGVDAVVLVASIVLAEGDDEQVLRDVVTAVIAANPDVPLGIYECPVPYHRVLTTDAVAWLAATKRFVFFKETSHDVGLMADRVKVSEGTPMKVFNAGIESLVESLQVGTAGLSGWVVNVYPEHVQWLTENGVPETPAAYELQAALDATERGMGPTYPNSAKVLLESRAALGFRPVSRWQPKDVDTASMDALRARVDEVAAEVVDA